MKKIQILKIGLLLIALCLVCKYIYDNYRVIPTTTLSVKEMEECDNSLKDYYSTDKGDYYLYCINDAVVDFTDRNLELDKALAARQVDIDTIKGMLTKKYSLNNKKVNYYQNDDISILECINKDKTNYIVGKNFEYIEGMCDTKPYLTTYTKEYYVLDISNSKTKDIIYLTLKDDIVDEVDTISISNTYSLKEGITYSFTFGKHSKDTLATIKDIFKNDVLLDIKEVKTDLENDE